MKRDDGDKRDHAGFDRALAELGGATAAVDDGRVRAILSAIDDGAKGSSPLGDDDLFAAPLPRAADEPLGGEARARDRKVLQDLARQASSDRRTDPSERIVAREREDDSGIVDLAAAAKADPEAEVRAKTTPLASEDLFAPGGGEARTIAAAPVARSATRPAPNEERTAADAAAAEITPAARPPERRETGPSRERRRPTVLTLAMGAVAIAASVFFFVRQNAPVPAPGAPPEATSVAAENAPPTATVPAAPSAEPPSEPTGADPHTLPGATVAVTPHSAPPHAGAGGAQVRPAAEPTATQTVSPPATQNAPDDLAAALDKELGGQRLKPAAAVSGSGTRRDKPSQGEVTGALGAVLSEARTCLGPDDPISRAAVVFGSDGTVQSVSVTGGAAGKPSEACIKAALAKAKTQPFSDPTFPASITIRHP